MFVGCKNNYTKCYRIETSNRCVLMKTIPKSFDECMQMNCEDCRVNHNPKDGICPLMQDFCISYRIATGNHSEYEPSTIRAHHYRAVSQVKRWCIPFICERCESKVGIEIHHIDRNPTNNKIENLEVLCKYCHREEHA